MYSLHQIIQITNASTYRFDTSGVVGMLGGENAVDALETIHLHIGRQWVGWYNYPGTITVARRFGQMANSRLWDSLFPGPNLTPAATFKLDGESGPDYRGSYSGTRLTTKYLGHLIADVCKDLDEKELLLIKKDGSKGRTTRASTVTIISFPPKQRDGSRQSEIISVPPSGDWSIALWALVPSLVSIASCVLCLVARDSICASLILVGIFCSGFSSLVLGGAKLKIHVPVPSAASPPGDGVMLAEDGSIIVLKGEEADVNVITKGVFELDFSCGICAHEKHHLVGLSSLFLMTQFLAQLLLIPRGSFFGQILYLLSFVASGVYHLFVASYERKKIHQDLLLRGLDIRVEKQMEKRKLGTRTQMAVFVCLLLGNGSHNPSMCKPDAVLTSIIPNDTPVWKYWRRKVVKELGHFWKGGPESLGFYAPAIRIEPEDDEDRGEHSHFTSDDLTLLGNLIDDAWSVFNQYPKWCDQTEVWKARDEEENEEKEKVHPVSGYSCV